MSILILDSPEMPSTLQLDSNQSCVFLTITPPDVANGKIINYNVSIRTFKNVSLFSQVLQETKALCQITHRILDRFVNLL